MEVCKVLEKMKSKLEMQGILNQMEEVLKRMVVVESEVEIYEQPGLSKQEQQANCLSI